MTHILTHLPLIAVFIATATMGNTAQTGYSTGEAQTLKRDPVITSKPALLMPGAAQIAGVEGKVTVRAFVNTDGRVVKTEIVERDPEFAYVFDEEARAYAMNCLFTPATDSAGNARSAWVLIPLNFVLEEFDPPVLLEVGMPEYPEEAKRLGIEGWVGLAVVVDEMGFVPRSVPPVILARQHPNVTLFDRAAIDAARRSRFTPGKGKSGPQRGWAFVKITFTIPE